MDPGAGNFKTQFQDEHTVFESFFLAFLSLRFFWSRGGLV
jgi:hypothetical protein